MAPKTEDCTLIYNGRIRLFVDRLYVDIKWLIKKFSSCDKHPWCKLRQDGWPFLAMFQRSSIFYSHALRQGKQMRESWPSYRTVRLLTAAIATTGCFPLQTSFPLRHRTATSGSGGGRGGHVEEEGEMRNSRQKTALNVIEWPVEGSGGRSLL